MRNRRTCGGELFLFDPYESEQRRLFARVVATARCPISREGPRSARNSPGFGLGGSALELLDADAHMPYKAGADAREMSKEFLTHCKWLIFQSGAVAQPDRATVS